MTRRPEAAGVRAVATYLLMAVALFVFQYGWHVVVGERPFVAHPPAGTWVSGWVQFDASWYQDVVSNGYSFTPGAPSNVAFFPLYPLAVRAVHLLGIDPWIAGVLVTVAAGAVMAWWWRRWLVEVARMPAASTSSAWWLLLVFPFSFFLLGPAYADTLLLATSLAAFVLAERGRPVAAGLAAALATAARPTGVAVVVGITLVQLLRSGALTVVPAEAPTRFRRVRVSFDRQAMSASSFAPLLGLAGIVAYSAFLWSRFGDPFAYVTTQSSFHAGTRPLFDLNVLSAVRKGWASATPATVAVGAVVLVAGAAAVVRLGRGRSTVVRAGIAAAALGVLGVIGRWHDFTVDPAYRTTIVVQAFVCVGVALAVPAVHRRLGLAYSAYTTVIVAAAVLTNGNFQSAGRYMLAAFPVAVVAAEWLAPRTALRRVWFATSATTMVLLAVAYSFVRFIA